MFSNDCVFLYEVGGTGRVKVGDISLNLIQTCLFVPLIILVAFMFN